MVKVFISPNIMNYFKDSYINFLSFPLNEHDSLHLILYFHFADSNDLSFLYASYNEASLFITPLDTELLPVVICNSNQFLLTLRNNKNYYHTCESVLIRYPVLRSDDYRLY